MLPTDFGVGKLFGAVVQAQQPRCQVGRWLIRDLAIGSLVADRRHVILIGVTGTDKIHPGIAIVRTFIRNASLRHECRNGVMFESLADACQKLALWRYDDNNVRPLSPLGNKTPAEIRRVPEQSEGPAPGALAQPETTTI